jgi:hypothetical protein
MREKPQTKHKAIRDMTTLKLTLWSEGRDPSECGIQIGNTRFSFEDLEAFAGREEAEAAGIPTALLDEYHGDWSLFSMWLEEQAN